MPRVRSIVEYESIIVLFRLVVSHHAVVLVVLTDVEAYSLAACRYTHRYHLIGKPVKRITYQERIYADCNHCCKVDEEYLQCHIDGVLGAS